MLQKQIYKSNKSIYFQVSLQKKVLISLKKKKRTENFSNLGSMELLSFYQRNALKLSTLSFFLCSFSKEKKAMKINLSQQATEYAIESGLLK